jgi:signal peptidase II
LVAGGALGNVIDRIRAGAVFDFLDFYVRTGSGREWHWPAFNLADSAITVGVILLLLDGLFHRADHAKTTRS